LLVIFMFVLVFVLWFLCINYCYFSVIFMYQLLIFVLFFKYFSVISICFVFFLINICRWYLCFFSICSMISIYQLLLFSRDFYVWVIVICLFFLKKILFSDKYLILVFFNIYHRLIFVQFYASMTECVPYFFMYPW